MFISDAAQISQNAQIRTIWNGVVKFAEQIRKRTMFIAELVVPLVALVMSFPYVYFLFYYSDYFSDRN